MILWEVSCIALDLMGVDLMGGSVDTYISTYPSCCYPLPAYVVPHEYKYSMNISTHQWQNLTRVSSKIKLRQQYSCLRSSSSNTGAWVPLRSSLVPRLLYVESLGTRLHWGDTTSWLSIQSEQLPPMLMMLHDKLVVALREVGHAVAFWSIEISKISSSRS